MTDWNHLTAARTLWQEARGEPLIGQQAVAHVIVNRLRDGRWGKTLAEVCLWRDQFSGWRSTDPNFGASCELSDADPAVQALANVLTNAFTAPDPTGGALFYYAKSMLIAPAWAPAMRKCGVFGRQVYFSDRALPAGVMA